MSELRLKSGVSFAPSGMAFVDKKTGFKVDAYERGIDGARDILIGHRRANPKVFNPEEFQHFSPTLVKQELLRHLHSKAPQLFKGEAVPVTTRTESGMPKQCTCGGTEFNPHQCPTCDGHRIDGYSCVKCGKITGL